MRGHAKRGSHGFGGCGGHGGGSGGGDVDEGAAFCFVFIPTTVVGRDRDGQIRGTHISRYVSNASFAAISSLRSFGGGTGPSSDGGSYSFDHGDLRGEKETKRQKKKRIVNQHGLAHSSHRTGTAKPGGKEP